MVEIRSSARSLKWKRQRVDDLQEFLRGCGRFPIVMDSSDSEDKIVAEQPSLRPVSVAAPRKYPPPRILEGGSVQRDFPIRLKHQDSTFASKDSLSNVGSLAKSVDKAAIDTGPKKRACPPPRILKGCSVRRDFPIGFKHQDYSSASKDSSSNITAAKLEKAVVNTGPKKQPCPPPRIGCPIRKQESIQISPPPRIGCPIRKRESIQVSHSISANGRRKQNKLDNAPTNGRGSQNFSSVFKNITIPRRGKSFVDCPKPLENVRPTSSAVNLDSKELGWCQASNAIRGKVNELVNLYRKTLSKLLKRDEFESNTRKASGAHISVAMFLKTCHKWINIGKRFGPVPGVEIGDIFLFRAELKIIGLHSQFYHGIDYTKKNGVTLATSIVVTERYANYSGSPNVLIYSGEGGNPVVRRNQQLKDQKLERGNLALKQSMGVGSPVRVIYKVKLKSSKTSSFGGTDRQKNLNNVYVYDGLYKVEDYWQERGNFGKLVFKFKLIRIFGQPNLSQGLARSKMHTFHHVSINDIFRGKKLIPIW